MDELSIENTLANIERRWEAADCHVLRGLFPALAGGEALTARALADRIDRPEAEVASALSFPTVGVNDGRLVELYGFMLAPTMHRVVVRDRALFACCAVVVHGLPTLLAERVDVESVDPVSRRVVRMSLSDGAAIPFGGDGACATMPRSPEDWTGLDVREVFCSHARHFTNEETAREFAQRDSRREVVSLQRMHEIGSDLARRIWL